MNSRRFMCSPLSEDRTLPHRCNGRRWQRWVNRVVPAIPGCPVRPKSGTPLRSYRYPGSNCLSPSIWNSFVSVGPMFGHLQPCGIRLLADGTGSTSRCYRQRGTRTVRVHAQEKISGKGSQETRMQDVPTDTKQRMPSSQVLEEVIHQAPAEYVTVGWLTST